jgi:hypothetical protein
MTLMVSSGSIIQSSLGPKDIPNFEAVVFLPRVEGRRDRGELQHYFRENTRPDKSWQKAQIINDRHRAETNHEVTGPGCIIEAKSGHFEVVVPEPGGLSHYWRENNDVHTPWQRLGVFAPSTTGPGALVQNPGNDHLEVIVRQGRSLYHYWRDDSLVWRRTEAPITRAADGAPALIWSSYGNLEVVVQEGSQLVLYWRDHLTPGLPWKAGGVVAPEVSGPPGFVQGPFGSADEHKNFEVVVPVGDRIEHWWRDNSDKNLRWLRGGSVTNGAGIVSASALCTSQYDDRLEILAQECEHSIFHYYRYRVGGERIYHRSACLRIDEGVFSPDPGRDDRPMSFKINQLTGECDFQEDHQTQSLTESRYGLRGTDLGASFEHNGKLFFLFGDTHWVNESLPGTADSIAYTPDSDPWNGVTLYFHHSYLEVEWPGIPSGWHVSRQGEFDVPLDGFSFGGQIFVFFSTDHFTDRKVGGRSVLTRCVESNPVFEESNPASPLKFTYLAEFSRRKFIHVSVERVDAATNRRLGLGDQEGLLIWGTGAYRADNVYLAYMPLGHEDVIAGLNGTRPFQDGVPRMHYFAGVGRSGPRWSGNELDAVPLFFPAAIGEFSVRWNSTLRAWVMMYMSGPDDPIGLAACLRLSRAPWGPWSNRRKLLDWVADGMGYRVKHQSKVGWFIHDPAANPLKGLWKGTPSHPAFRDTLYDDIIGGRDATEGGGAYGPYQIPRYTRQKGITTHLFYVLSTWNPYQVVLLRHQITSVERYVLLRGPMYVLLTGPFFGIAASVHSTIGRTLKWLKGLFIGSRY